MTIKTYLENEYKRTGDARYLTALSQYRRIKPDHRTIALAGINRHIKACKKHDIIADVHCLFEIILDAAHGRAVWLETDEEFWTTEVTRDLIRGVETECEIIGCDHKIKNRRLCDQHYRQYNSPEGISLSLA